MEGMVELEGWDMADVEVGRPFGGFARDVDDFLEAIFKNVSEIIFVSISWDGGHMISI